MFAGNGVSDPVALRIVATTACVESSTSCSVKGLRIAMDDSAADKYVGRLHTPTMRPRRAALRSLDPMLAIADRLKLLLYLRAARQRTRC